MRGGWFFNFDSLYSYLIDSDRVQNIVCQISNQVEADSHLQPTDWISGFNPEKQNGAQMSFSRYNMVSFTLPVTAFSNIKSWFDPISAPPNLSPPLRNRTYAFPSPPGSAFNCHNCRHTLLANNADRHPFLTHPSCFRTPGRICNNVWPFSSPATCFTAFSILSDPPPEALPLARVWRVSNYCQPLPVSMCPRPYRSLAPIFNHFYSFLTVVTHLQLSLPNFEWHRSFLSIFSLFSVIFTHSPLYSTIFSHLSPSSLVLHYLQSAIFDDL